MAAIFPNLEATSAGSSEVFDCGQECGNESQGRIRGHTTPLQSEYAHATHPRKQRLCLKSCHHSWQIRRCIRLWCPSTLPSCMAISRITRLELHCCSSFLRVEASRTDMTRACTTKVSYYGITSRATVYLYRHGSALQLVFCK